MAVGFPIAGRRDPALDDLVGLLRQHTRCCGSTLAGDPRLPSCSAQVQQRSLAAYEHQDVPFEVLVERLNPHRSLTHHPLVQVMLAWQNFTGRNSDPLAGLGLDDVQVSAMPVDTRTARMDLCSRWPNISSTAASRRGFRASWNSARMCSTPPASRR